MQLGMILQDLQNGARARRKDWERGTYLVCRMLAFYPSKEVTPKLQIVNKFGKTAPFDPSFDDLVSDDWMFEYPFSKDERELTVGQDLYMYAVHWIIVEAKEVSEPLDDHDLERTHTEYTAICKNALIYKMPAIGPTVLDSLVDGKILCENINLISNACLKLMDALADKSFNGDNIAVRVPTNAEIQEWFPEKAARICGSPEGATFPYWTCIEKYSKYYTQVDQDGDVRTDLRSDMDPTLFGAFRPVICWSVY